MIIIGYSGHAFVAIGILSASGNKVVGYCDVTEKAYNPFELDFYGSESSKAGKEKLKKENFFIGVGDNKIRKKIFDEFAAIERYPVNAVHPTAVISEFAGIAAYGIMISAGVCINPLSRIGIGAICNTGCIIEHECVVGDFSHIGPGTVLCGGVTVGEGSFIGAGAVIKQAVRIGKNAVIGAGAVVIKDIADNEIVVGNPSRKIKNNI